MNVKTILISQFSLPYSKIGSWTKMYEYYLSSNHKIDILICEKPNNLLNVNYEIVKKTLLNKIKNKYTSKNKTAYISKLNNIIKQNEKYVIQIVDDFKMYSAVHDFLVNKQFRKHIHIQFFYHGFEPISTSLKEQKRIASIDEMIVLTKASYKDFRNKYNDLPTQFSVLHNGIDKKKFFKLDDADKKNKRENKEINDKIIFLWCSHNRPKKGLHILLSIWNKIYKKHKNIELWVIGCEEEQQQEGINYLGLIPNDELPKYLQLSDCYLFPTLCKEGFGLTLIEALSCGNFCIASSIGGVPEVLEYGELGKLIENPNFTNEWENAILDFIKSPNKNINLKKNQYSIDNWVKEMNFLISNAKAAIAQKN